MPRFQPAIDVIDDLCLLSGDLQKRKKGLFLTVADMTWQDLNETTLRIAKRVKIPVRKKFALNKKTNSIDLPCDSLRVSSINVVDEKSGVIYPVYRNLRLHDDLVEMPATSNCACEYKCGNQLCNSIKGYVAIQTTQTDTLPDGTPISANCVTRIAVGKNGVVYKEEQSLQRVYTNGVWTNTVVQTESKEMCQCETDDNGCVCDTEENVNIMCGACGISNFNPNINSRYLNDCRGGTASCPPDPNCNEWTYYCNSKMDWFSVQCGDFPFGFRRGSENIYNIGENGNRIIFPHNFGFEKALVRFYEDISVDELLIPYVAKDVYMTGLQYFAYKQNMSMQNEAELLGNRYSREKWGLFLELNKMRLAELGKTINPATRFPSYIGHRDVFNGLFY